MTPLRILIVEDETLIAADLQDALERQGYDVPMTVRSGEMALDVFDAVRPDLVLLDINLKGQLTGIDVARALRQRRAVPFIFLSGLADRPTLDAALATAPAAYLVKPFVERDLAIAIELALTKSAAALAAPANPEAPEANPEAADPSPAAAADPDPAAAPAPPAYVLADAVFVRENGRFVKVPLAEICVLEAQGNYCLLRTPERRYMLAVVLGHLLPALAPALPGLVRVHRSFAVNLAHVTAFDEGEVELGPKLRVPVGATYRAALLARLPLLG